VNHTRFPKEDHLPDWARRDNQIKKGDPVECATHHSKIGMSEGILINLTSASQICAYVLNYYNFCGYQSLCCPVKTTRARRNLKMSS
jgi:hypothetical protein